MARDALLQLRSLREQRVEDARLALAKADRAAAEARHDAALAAQAVADYRAAQESLMAACYAPVLGRESSRAEVADARTEAGEVLLERARLEEAQGLAQELAEEREAAAKERRTALARLERRLEALVLLQERRDKQAAREAERQDDELLDSLSEARWARGRGGGFSG